MANQPIPEKKSKQKSTNGSAPKGTVVGGLSTAEIIADYKLAVESRQASYLGRREVLTGKAKFGIFGDGKELAQIAMAHAFQHGDWRSGYYRDQTFMFAIGESDVQKFFAQLYAHTDVVAEPASAGRSMNGHFATRFLDDNGQWLKQSDRYNVSADVSPTGSQMPRLVGLAYASVLYRDLSELSALTDFTTNGNEVAFGTIGNASAAEGMFWESVNAIGVLKAPAVISIWDDGYGISVSNEFQHTKGNVGELLRGFQREPGAKTGYDIHVVRGWDYTALVETYNKAAHSARTEHVPQIIHVIEVTQPQGHSTSGSHERYKSPERMQWEKDFDCIMRMKEWMIDQNIATSQELENIENEATQRVQDQKQAAWNAYSTAIKSDVTEAATFLETLKNNPSVSAVSAQLDTLLTELRAIREPFRRDVYGILHRAMVCVSNTSERRVVADWLKQFDDRIRPLYASHLTSESSQANTAITHTTATYADDAQMVNGSDVMNACFDANFTRDPRIVAFGEDLGQLGDVNQGFIGLQKKFGAQRVADVGIRECTIIGQAIGMAMRGLRPIAEIQYLDYLLYALQIMSDDLATVQWRTKGGQKAPVIVRTRGHRLEGIWHSGSPMAGVINLIRGIHVCVPRNMTQAAGMYNTLLRSDEPALIVEVLNGYRLKEKLPSNPGEFTVPLGIPEIIREGTDVTLVTYGATCRVAMEAAQQLSSVGIEVEVIDVQTLLPFDTTGVIRTSLSKTNRLIVADEDVPGGATAFMLQRVLDRDGAWTLLDAAPTTITAREHRPAYGTDGNFWSKPEAEHIFDAVYKMMNEADPTRFAL